MKKYLNRGVSVLFTFLIITLTPMLVHQGQAVAADAKITVLSPMGKPPPIQFHAMAPRLDTLKGKTIYIVDDGYVGGDVLLKEMVSWFERNMPEVTAVYRRKAGAFTAEDPELWAEIEAKGDAMIMGMGH
jgi:hypothetical protein